MKHLKHIALIILPFILCIIACNSSHSNNKVINPPANGFNISESDQEAINIADEVMVAIGGRQAWDNAQFFKWTFFGRRTHIWDKQNKIVKIDVPDQKMQYLLNMDDMSGSVAVNGVTITDKDSLNNHLENAYKMWINDSYWLFMPFKLKDSGVTIKNIGIDTTLGGKPSKVLQLTFQDVGVTPNNKYLIYVDSKSNLVAQWDYYANFKDSTARFQSPWNAYEKYGSLLLSGGSIGSNQITNIETGPELSELLSIESD